ncbi:MAG TPA: hypothetical protein VEU47_03800 [Candidatus Cybelea sp.]|nr:hypothetical protein [Candidatus Cybelea sp.]
MSAVFCIGGRRRRLASIVAVIAWLGMVTSGLAEDSAPPKPAARPAEASADAARQRREADENELRHLAEQMYSLDPRIPRKPAQAAFCTQFLADLHDLRGIEAVPPIIMAKNYDDPALHPFRARCPDLRMEKSVEANFEVLSEAEQDEVEAAYYATGPMEVFQLDVKNRRKDQYYFLYSKNICTKSQKHCEQDDIGLLDMNACTGGWATGVSSSGKSGGRVYLIRYRGSEYLLTTDMVVSGDHYSASRATLFDFSKVRNRRPAGPNEYCQFKS